VTRPASHDHHLHLFALAAALRSADCGPGAARGRAGLGRALGAAPRDAQGWVRGVGYHESVAGPLERTALDALRDDAPVRVQHRSGQLWMLNSRAVAALGLEEGGALPSGVERDAAGRPTGRLFGCDAWLRARLGAEAPPSLAPVGALLAGRGIGP
jgi:predicted amidohydrolase YtcJ